jgi:hypothetical protein
MSEAKTKWIAANAAVEAIEAERAALLKPTDDRYNAALEVRDEIEEETGEMIGRCESCMVPIFDGDLYEVDLSGDVMTCVEDSHSLADILAHPDAFVDADENPHTPESAKAFVDARLSEGMTLADKPFLIGGEG